MIEACYVVEFLLQRNLVETPKLNISITGHWSVLKQLEPHGLVLEATDRFISAGGSGVQ